ncbi:MAG: hypothetical protein BJ554DRAFT_1706 [Olpidium bornovanus]|uniref:Uncharacterized protein n=1 Tax=Olpidium bornovanus TaxID=278681 RepID=A0A8H7ZS00_9FUNG|nr:MAG: hypothetical protein BJ554DRAFT_1706 [Olpidium bornovanus]
MSDTCIIRPGFSVQSVAALSRIAKLTKDPDLVIEAILESEVLQLSDDKIWFRATSRRNYLSDRTIYAAGIPVPVEQPELEAFFGQFEGLEAITLRLPRGAEIDRGAAVLATYDTPEAATKVLARRPLIFNGVHLTVSLRKPRDTENRVHQNQNLSLYVAGFPRAATSDDISCYFENYGDVKSIRCLNLHPNKPLAAFVEFTCEDDVRRVASIDHVYASCRLTLQSRDPSINALIANPHPKERQNTYSANARGGKGGNRLKRPHSQERPGKPSASFPQELNTVVHFSGAAFLGVTNQDIKEAFQQFAPVRNVDFRRDETSGHVVLHQPNAANFVTRVREARLRIGGDPVHVRTLEPEEEKAYLQCAKVIAKKPRLPHGLSSAEQAKTAKNKYNKKKAQKQRNAAARVANSRSAAVEALIDGLSSQLEHVGRREEDSAAAAAAAEPYLDEDILMGWDDFD